MSRHSTSFEAEREVSAESAQELARRPNPSRSRRLARPGPVPAAKPTGLAPAAAGGRRRRRAGRRVLVRLGLLDGRPLPGLDRRRLCARRQHHHRAEGFGLSARSTGRRQRACKGRPSAGANRRARFQGRARPGQGRRRRGAGHRHQQAGPTRGPASRSLPRRRRPSRSTSQQDFRRPGEQALHRPCRHRLRQRAERASRAIQECRARRRRSCATRPILFPR